MSEFIIREARAADAYDLRELYFEHLTKDPPEEEQDMVLWAEFIEDFAENPNHHLLVIETDGRVVATVTLVIVKNLTHNMQPYGVIEYVVTHENYWGKGYATKLLDRATEIAKERNCYKVMLMTGSKKESTLNFYRKAGFECGVKTAFDKRL